MKIALLQMSISDKKQKNIEKAISFLKQAKENKADMAILPEMFCCPYAAQNFPIYAEEQGGMVWQALSKTAKECNMYLVGGSMPEREKEAIIILAMFLTERENKLQSIEKCIYLILK